MTKRLEKYLAFDCFSNDLIASTFMDDEDLINQTVDIDIPIHTIIEKCYQLDIICDRYTEEYNHGARTWTARIHPTQDQLESLCSWLSPFVQVHDTVAW